MEKFGVAVEYLEGRCAGCLDGVGAVLGLRGKGRMLRLVQFASCKPSVFETFLMFVGVRNSSKSPPDGLKET